MQSTRSCTARALGRSAVIAVALFAAAVSTAYAHGALKSSTPSAGAHLGKAPFEIRLTFTEAPELAVTRIELVGPDGKPVSLDPLRAVADSSKVIVARITGPLSAGAHTVRWQIAGKDGHLVRGRFSFTIAPGSAGLGAIQDSTRRVGPEAGASGTAPGQAPLPGEHHDPVAMPESDNAFDSSSPLYVLVRWLTFAGILVVIGALAFHYVVLGFLRRKPNADAAMLTSASARAATIGWWTAVTLGVVVFLRLFAQSYALHGHAQALNGELISSMLSRTVWGWGWLLQVTAIVVAVLAFRAARRGSGAGWQTAAVAALALAFTPALSGHASSAPRLTLLAILADSGHVIGAGGWLGSLLLVLAAGIPAALRMREDERGPAVAELVNAFSPTALVFAGILATTGLFAAWLHVGAISGLWQSQYGRTLLIKLAVLSVVALTGAYNWRRVKPTLGDDAGTRRIRRSAAAELAVAVIVVAVTAVLVATPTTMDERMMSPDTPPEAAASQGAAALTAPNDTGRTSPP